MLSNRRPCLYLNTNCKITDKYSVQHIKYFLSLNVLIQQKENIHKRKCLLFYLTTSNFYLNKSRIFMSSLNNKS